MAEIITWPAVLKRNPSAILVDAFGVLYGQNGVFPGVPEALKTAQKRGIPILLVTNNADCSPKIISDRLAKLDIQISESHVISAGLGLILDPEIQAQLQGQQVFGIGPESAFSWIPNPNWTWCTSLSEATQVVLPSCSNENFIDQFTALENNPTKLPLICTNPDRYIAGTTELCPVIGFYAQKLEAQGFPVLWFGKPHLNFSKLVKSQAYRQKIDLSTAWFLDDNWENVAALSNDLGITGCLVRETGLARFPQFNPPQIPPDFILSKLG